MSKFSSNKAPIVIDGANVAHAYGSGGKFDLRGILLSVTYFQRLHHSVAVILPSKYRVKCEQDDDDNAVALRQLRDENILSFAPGGSNDDDFIIQRAVKTGAFILSCDKYEEEKRKHPEWRPYVESYRLNFTFVNGDDFTPNPTPLGTTGPTLKQFLSRKPIPLSSERHVLDAACKSNQQLLSDILHLHKRANIVENPAETHLQPAASKKPDSSIAVSNTFQVLLESNESNAKSIPEAKSIAEAPSKQPEQQLTQKVKTPKCLLGPGEAEDDDEESPFRQILTGFGTVIECGEKRGFIKIDLEKSGSTHLPCSVVEFHPYACLGCSEDLKIDETQTTDLNFASLMNRFPVGIEVGFVAAVIDDRSLFDQSIIHISITDQLPAMAIQICRKDQLLHGYAQCDKDAIFADHAFLVSRSGPLHWSPGYESILLFGNAFGGDPAQKCKDKEKAKHRLERGRRLHKLLCSRDMLEYCTMPTPAIGLFDACPIVVKANFLRLTGLIVRTHKEYGVIRSARVHDDIIFRKNNLFSQAPDVEKNENGKSRLSVGDWVRFRLRKCEAKKQNSGEVPGTRRNTHVWKAHELEKVSKPDCVFTEAQIVKARKGAAEDHGRIFQSADTVLKLTAIGFAGTLKPRNGVVWCQAIGRVHLDAALMLTVDPLQYPSGTAVKIEAVYRANEKHHPRKDTVWYATNVQKLTKNERKRFGNISTTADKYDHLGSLHISQTATVDFYEEERRWAGLHGPNSRYILYDRFEDVQNNDGGKMEPGEMVTVTYVDPPVDSPLYVALAVKCEGKIAQEFRKEQS